jgi:hypothetical protein
MAITTWLLMAIVTRVRYTLSHQTAKVAVENCDSVRKVSDDSGTNYARVLPPNDEKYILNSLAQTDKRTLLDARSGKWVKQEAAGDAAPFLPHCPSLSSVCFLRRTFHPDLTGEENVSLR